METYPPQKGQIFSFKLNGLATNLKLVLSNPQAISNLISETGWESSTLAVGLEKLVPAKLTQFIDNLFDCVLIIPICDESCVVGMHHNAILHANRDK